MNESRNKHVDKYVFLLGVQERIKSSFLWSQDTAVHTISEHTCHFVEIAVLQFYIIHLKCKKCQYLFLWIPQY